MTLNALQKTVLREFSNGDYEHMIELTYSEVLETADDLLLIFFMHQLKDLDLPGHAEDGIYELEHARDEIDVALAALQKLQDAYEAKLAPILVS